MAVSGDRRPKAGIATTEPLTPKLSFAYRGCVLHGRLGAVFLG